ncbi:nucleoside transporter [Salmonella enterica]|nr:nucleoside transporter [Salmonella enterica]
MRDGIYTVVFEGGPASVGEGVVVVTGGYVHGGDIAFTCRGKLEEGRLRLEVKHYNRDIPSATGMAEGDYVLAMRYRQVEGGYAFRGHVEGHPSHQLDAYAVFVTPLLTEKD